MSSFIVISYLCPKQALLDEAAANAVSREKEEEEKGDGEENIEVKAETEGQDEVAEERDGG